VKKIIVIPLKPSEPKKLKVAAYCHVSTLSPTQRRSLDWQIKSYTKMISEQPGTEDFLNYKMSVF
jgi:hypothetical protein